MGVITSFLKLFKPAPNDYVDVEKHLNENYDKIDTWAKDLVVNDLTTGGATNALSGEMGKYLFERFGGMNFIEGLQRLGLSHPCTLKEIVQKIPKYTVFFTYYSTEQYFTELKEFQIANNLNTSGSLYIIKDINARIYGIAQGANCQISISFTEQGDIASIEFMLNNKSKIFLGHAGITEVKYIQDAGTKTINLGYIDRDTGKLYRARETNTDVTVTNKFEPADNINNSKNIDEIGKTYATVNNEGTSSNNKVSVLSQTKASTIFQIQVEGFYLCIGNTYVQGGSDFIKINKNGAQLVSNRGSTASINTYCYLSVGDKIEFKNEGSGLEFQYTIIKIG